MSESLSIPSPVGGWNTRDSIDLLPLTDSPNLVNWFPNSLGCSLRNGFRVQSSSMGSGQVQTIAEYTGVDGTKKLVAAANGNIYNATTLSGSGSSLGSGFTSNKWQFTNFRSSAGASRLILCNGVDQPQQYDGTTLSAANYTGIADDAKLIQPISFASALFFAEIDSTSFWHLTAGAITGALSEFTCGGDLKLGGYISFIASWTRDNNQGVNDQFVVVSSEGEVLVYVGTDPSTSTKWERVGRYFIGPPLSRRSWCNVGSDLVILTQNGLISLDKVIASVSSTDEYTKLNEKMDPAINSAARLYKDNYGWQVVHYPRGQMLIVNIPIASGITYEQYVVNLLTGAATRFTNQNGVSWGTYNQRLYFGGLDGKVYEADYGTDDNGAEIPAVLQTTYFFPNDDRQNVKQLLMLRPILSATNRVQISVTAFADFNRQAGTATITGISPSGAEWDVADWNTSNWSQDAVAIDNWKSITGLGRSFSLKLSGSFKNVSVSVTNFYVIFQTGDVL